MIELYFAPGACSFVPHVALEIVRAATGTGFEPKMVRLHKGEHKTPEYLAINPNAQVPVLVVDGKPLNQLVAICDYLDRRFSQAELLPTEPWARAHAVSKLTWMNNTVHPTFTHIFLTGYFAQTDAGKADVRETALGAYRTCLERIQRWITEATPYLLGERVSILDAYAFTLFRWSGYANIDPATLPAYRTYVERVMAAAPVAKALELERIKLDTYKPAA